MTNIDLINEHIQKRLLTERKNEVTAIEAAVWLDTAGVLSDSQVRRGLPLRRLLREKLIAGQIQRPNRQHGRWFIQQASSSLSEIVKKPSSQQHFKTSLAPIVDSRSRILILGTLPGDESLRQQRYYANPRNQFWTILQCVYGRPFGTDDASRIDLVRERKIALWDVLDSAVREGSLDSAIKSEKPNSFRAFLSEYPDIQVVAFNGTTSEKLFRKHVDANDLPPGVTTVTLPSSSPTPGRNVLSLDRKIEAWGEVLLTS